MTRPILIWWGAAALAALLVAMILPAENPPAADAVAGESERMPSPPRESASESASPDCAACHECPRPTRSSACLRLCTRARGAGSLPAHGPDSVVLDDLEELYVPVRFDHRSHARMAGFSTGCTSCHHFTPESAAHPACRSCHPPTVAREDLAQPGLKGAYHRLCFRCHAEWDQETSCEVCHQKRAGGRLADTALPPMHSGSRYATLKIKDLILFETGYGSGDVVPFHHANHATLYETNCAACHRGESCAACHTHRNDSHPMGSLSEVDLHDTCFSCHLQNGAARLTGRHCEDCHGRDPGALFTHASTGWPLAPYHRTLACRSCHGEWSASARLDRRCESCHRGSWDPATFDHAVTGVTLDDVHREAGCSDCHVAGVGRPASCSGCHDDDRDPATLGSLTGVSGNP